MRRYYTVTIFFFYLSTIEPCLIQACAQGIGLLNTVTGRLTADHVRVYFPLVFWGKKKSSNKICFMCYMSVYSRLYSDYIGIRRHFWGFFFGR